jgi:hypothetical protein
MYARAKRTSRDEWVNPPAMAPRDVTIYWLCTAPITSSQRDRAPHLHRSKEARRRRHLRSSCPVAGADLHHLRVAHSSSLIHVCTKSCCPGKNRICHVIGHFECGEPGQPLASLLQPQILALRSLLAPADTPEKAFHPCSHSGSSYPKRCVPRRHMQRPTFEGKPDSLPYRVLPSLQALLPKKRGRRRERRRAAVDRRTTVRGTIITNHWE